MRCPHAYWVNQPAKAWGLEASQAARTGRTPGTALGCNPHPRAVRQRMGWDGAWRHWRHWRHWPCPAAPPHSSAGPALRRALALFLKSRPNMGRLHRWYHHGPETSDFGRRPRKPVKWLANWPPRPLPLVSLGLVVLPLPSASSPVSSSLRFSFSFSRL